MGTFKISVNLFIKLFNNKEIIKRENNFNLGVLHYFIISRDTEITKIRKIKIYYDFILISVQQLNYFI